MTPEETIGAASFLFLSCDLTGSTNFKQQEPRNPTWQEVFLRFYRYFPQQIANEKVERDAQNLTFNLWKPVGDELIYYCPVRSEEDIYQAVRTWVGAMRSYESESLKGTGMGTKGGAFIATFPGPDSRSSVPREPDLEVSDGDVRVLNSQAYESIDHSRYMYDFFGPSIDTGFRVLTQCTVRFFTLSAEVALAMIGRSKILGSTQDQFKVDDLILKEFITLKGVWGGRAYPIVAIDHAFDDPVNQAYAEITRPEDPSKLWNLCLACYQSEKWPSRLYLPESQIDLFKVEPADSLAGSKPVTLVGAEEQADDEPPQAQDLADDAPLGDSFDATGYVRRLLPVGTEWDGAKEIIRREVKDSLAPGLRLVEFKLESRETTDNANELVYVATWGARIH